MSDRMTWRERSAWLAVVAGLAILVAWIATGCALAVLHSHLLPPPALALTRALARAVVALGMRTWPVLPLGALVGMMLALAVRPPVPARGKVRHV